MEKRVHLSSGERMNWSMGKMEPDSCGIMLLSSLHRLASPQAAATRLETFICCTSAVCLINRISPWRVLKERGVPHAFGCQHTQKS